MSNYTDKHIEVDSPTLRGFFKSFDYKQRLLIPSLYQRSFSWAEKDCIRLWGDVENILLALKDDPTRRNIIPHYMGTILLSQEVIEGQDTKFFILADGQQRMTAVSLLTKAIFDVWRRDEPSKENLAYYQNESAFEEILFSRDGHTGNGIRHGDEPLLQLTEVNHSEFQRLLSRGEVTPNETTMLGIAYQTFKRKAEEFSKKHGHDTLVLLPSAMEYLLIVRVKAERAQLQTIFETVNSLGVELSASELIKNFMTTGPQVNEAQKLYQDYWKYLDENYNINGEGKRTLSEDIIYPYLRASSYQGLSKQDKEFFEGGKSSARFGKNTLGIYETYKRRLKLLADGIDVKDTNSLLCIHTEESKRLLLTVALFEAMTHPQGEGISSVDGYRKLTTSLASNLHGFGEAKAVKLKPEFTRSLFQLWEVFANVIERKAIPFWFFQNWEFFNDFRRKPSDPGWFFQTVVQAITSYALRTQLVVGYGSGDETKLFTLLETSLSEAQATPIVANQQSIFLTSLLRGLQEGVKPTHPRTRSLAASTDAEVAAKIQTLSYQPKLEKKMIRYFFYQIEDSGLDENHNALFWATRGDNTIEHIYPQNPTESEWPGSSALRENQEHLLLVDSIGNLTLMSDRANSIEGNNSFEKKLKKGFRNHLRIEETLLEQVEEQLKGNQKPQWGTEEIRARGENLAQLITKEVLPSIDSILEASQERLA